VSTTTPSSCLPRQRTEVFTWPDGGQTPFAQSKRHDPGRRFPRAGDDPAGRARCRPGKVENGSSRARLFPTFLAAAENEHRRGLKKGKQIGDTTYSAIWTA